MELLPEDPKDVPQVKAEIRCIPGRFLRKLFTVNIDYGKAFPSFTQAQKG